MSKRQRVDPATGLELPIGVQYARQCPSAPYQASWQDASRKQRTKCFTTTEKAMQYRMQMHQDAACVHRQIGEPELTNTDSYEIESRALLVDVFVFATIHERLRLLLVWEVSAENMRRLGVLKTVSAKGRTNLTLPIAPPDGTNAALERSVFGSKKYTGSREVAKCLKVYPLPAGYCVQECMRGRDPVVHA